MFAKLKHFKLHVKEIKCHLLMASVEFLGHMLDADGVHVEKGKIEAVSAWPVPHNLNEVQQFFGTCQLLPLFCIPLLRIGWTVDQTHSQGCFL